MSLFSERMPPCWESFFQQPESSATEGQSSTHHGGESSRRGGPHHGPHHPHRGSRGDFNFGWGGRFPHHGHHGRHGPVGPDSDTERTHPFSSGPGGYGPWGHGGWFGRRGGHHHPYHHGSFRGRGRGRGVRIAPVPTHHSIPGLGDFLSQLAENIGNGFEEFVSAADRNARQTTDDKQVDFEPRADIFDTANEYIIHLSLPGANKSDINVEYDAEKSIVRVAGVVHRPEFSEELNESLVWNERRHEVGVFERQFRVVTDGSRPIDVDGDSMTAKMVDGVLIVRLKKVQTEQQQQSSRDGKKIVIDDDDDLYTADDAEEVKKQADNHEEQDTETENTVTNEKHASVIEVQDEMDSMRLSSETEVGDLMEEVETTIYTPSEGSEEDAVEAAEYVKINAEH